MSDLALNSLIEKYRFAIALFLFVFQLKLLTQYSLYVLLSLLAVKSECRDSSFILLHKF